MYTPVATITQRATSDKLNILCMDTHESYQTNLCKTGHNFYSLYDPKQKKWDAKYRPVPDNYHRIIPQFSENHLQNGVYFDLVLSQNKFGQFETLSEIAKRIQAPLISLEHTLPLPNWPRFERIKAMRGDFNIYLSEYSRSQWESEGDLIHNCVDTDVFFPVPQQYEESYKFNHALSIVNEWKNRDFFCGYRLWEQVTYDIVTHVRGDNDWTTPTKDVDELVQEYRSSPVFLNTSLNSTCPTTVLEAMACGTPVVTTATTMLPEIIEHGVNGFITNDPKELNYYTKMLICDLDLSKKLGYNARKTIEERFSLNSFVEKWNNMFDKTREFVFRG